MPQDPLPPTGEIILYSTEDGRARVECRFAGETVWLTQALRAELFDISVPTVNEHLRNVKGFTMDDERLKNPPVEGSGVPD